MQSEHKNQREEKWILVNIGRIECGVSSQIVGVFSSLKKAEEYKLKLNARMSWRDGGQNDYQIFPMPDIGVIHNDYIEACK